MARHPTIVSITQRINFFKKFRKFFINKLTPNQQGWSLIELLSVISLISILYSIVLFPMYRHYSLETQLETKANQLCSSLQWARHLALCYQTTVTLSSKQQTVTASTSWNCGWIIALKMANTPGVTKIIKQYPTLLNSQNLIWNGARGVKVVQFNAQGYATGYNGHFTLSYKDTTQSRTLWLIWVSSTGRIRLEKINQTLKIT